jgi:uncharacterized protein
VIAVDTNLLVYAHRADSSWHHAAHSCIKGLAEGRAPWAIPAPCLHEWLAVVTHPRIYVPPTPLDDGLAFVDRLLAAPTLVVLAEGDGYWPVLAHISRAANVAGPRIHDARIAALCLFHGVAELWTADRDFGRFPQLKTRNPLVTG